MAAREISSGGVVLRGDEVVVIVPSGRKIFALPKGHIDPGENAAEAAAREVREEAGVVGENLGKLSDVNYSYRRGSKRIEKTVTFFLFRYESGDIADHDHEVDEVRWMPINEALKALEFDGEREMVALAAKRAAEIESLSK